MRTLLLIVAFALHSAASAAPLELHEGVRDALQAARTAQLDGRNDDALRIGQAALGSFVGSPDVPSWQLAPLLRTMAQAHEQAGSPLRAAATLHVAASLASELPPAHDGLRRWMAAEAALSLRRAGVLAAARHHMDAALHDIATFMATADDADRASAVETLLDDVALALAEDRPAAAAASLATALAAARRYALDTAEIEQAFEALVNSCDARGDRCDTLEPAI